MPDNLIYVALTEALHRLKEDEAVALDWIALHQLQGVLANCQRRILEIAHQKAADMDMQLARIAELLQGGTQRGGAVIVTQRAADTGPEEEEEEAQAQAQAQAPAGRGEPGEQNPEGAVPAAPQGKSKSFYVSRGVFAGMHSTSKVTCIRCGARVRVHEAVRTQWPEPGLCPACAQPDPVPVRSGPVASNPWEGVPPVAAVHCGGCRARSVAEFARSVWPFPDLCDKCAQDTEPAPDNFLPLVTHNGTALLGITEKALDHFAAAGRTGKEIVGEPVVALRPEGRIHQGYLLNVTDTPPEDAQHVTLHPAGKESYKARQARQNTVAGKRERHHQGLRSRGF